MDADRRMGTVAMTAGGEIRSYVRLAVVWLALLSTAVCAQEVAPQPSTTPPLEFETKPEVLILDFDKFYLSSAFSSRIDAEIQAEIQIIRTENDKIVEELEAEERRLTDLRATLSADEFQEMAEAFDEKVQALREEPIEKERELLERRANARQYFLQAAQPILQQIMSETGASVIIDRRNVIMHASTRDITSLAIARTDAVLDQGADLEDVPLLNSDQNDGSSSSEAGSLLGTSQD